MTARYLQAIHGTGAYAGMKPGRASIGGAGSATPYKIDNTLHGSFAIYMNTVPCGFWRAPGAMQAAFASESHIDLRARTENGPGEVPHDEPDRRRRRQRAGKNLERHESERDIAGRARRRGMETTEAPISAAASPCTSAAPSGQSLGKSDRRRRRNVDGIHRRREQGTGLQTILCQTVGGNGRALRYRCAVVSATHRTSPTASTSASAAAAEPTLIAPRRIKRAPSCAKNSASQAATISPAPKIKSSTRNGKFAAKGR